MAVGNYYLDNYGTDICTKGDYNEVEHIQMGKIDTMGIWTYTVIQILWTFTNTQRGNGGRKTATLELNGNGHTVDVLKIQKGSNTTATIDLTFGTGAYTLDLDFDVNVTF